MRNEIFRRFLFSAVNRSPANTDLLLSGSYGRGVVQARSRWSEARVPKVPAERSPRDAHLARQRKKFVSNAISAENTLDFLKKAEDNMMYLHPGDMRAIIEGLRGMSRYEKSLKVSEWMQERIATNPDWIQRDFNKTKGGDSAILLDLIAKVRGIEAAEDFFEELPSEKRNLVTYSALLHCYCKDKLEGKAEALLHKIHKKLGFRRNRLPYVNMMSLYLSLNKPEKVLSLVDVMKVVGVHMNPIAYNLWMSACAAVSDFDSIDEIVETATKRYNGKLHWTTYSNLINIYLKGGFPEKAYSYAEGLENDISDAPREAYNRLIKYYGLLNDEKSLFRVWQSLKEKCYHLNYSNYKSMHRALLVLKDIKGAQNIFDEWMSTEMAKDYELSCSFLKSYIAEELFEEAHEFLAKFTDCEMDSKKWEIVAEIFLRYNCIDKALEMITHGFAELKWVYASPWAPKADNILSILNYYKEKADVDAAEKVLKLLSDHKCASIDAYNSLLSAYVNAGKGSSAEAIRRRITRDGLIPNDETNDLLNQAKKKHN